MHLSYGILAQWVIQANLNYVRVPKYSESAGWHNTRSEARFRLPRGRSQAWLSQPRRR